MIDYHSHILPGMDDGSSCVPNSVEMLRRLRAQGVDTVLLTPHFDPKRETAESFLQRRQAAWEQLKTELPEDMPRLLRGAEVRYRREISRTVPLKQLCTEGTDLLLLEMPFSHWSGEIVQEVCGIAASGEVTVLLAHIERYVLFQSRKTWEHLARQGVLMQSNAELFLPPVVRCYGLYLLRQGRIQVLGTDTHDLSLRAPHMDRAMGYIKRRLGEKFAVQFAAQTENILDEASRR